MGMLCPFGNMIVQKLKKEVNSSFDLAEKYYRFISELNSLKLTNREIQLVAFTAIRGNITNGNVREEFCRNYDSTSPTINNMISRMRKLGIFIKDGRKVKVNPVLVLDFTKDVALQITLIHKNEGDNNKEGSKEI